MKIQSDKYNLQIFFYRVDEADHAEHDALADGESSKENVVAWNAGSQAPKKECVSSRVLVLQNVEKLILFC